MLVDHFGPIRDRSEKNEKIEKLKVNRIPEMEMVSWTTHVQILEQSFKSITLTMQKNV